MCSSHMQCNAIIYCCFFFSGYKTTAIPFFSIDTITDNTKNHTIQRDFSTRESQKISTLTSAILL